MPLWCVMCSSLFNGHDGALVVETCGDASDIPYSTVEYIAAYCPTAVYGPALQTCLACDIRELNPAQLAALPVAPSESVLYMVDEYLWRQYFGLVKWYDDPDVVLDVSDSRDLRLNSSNEPASTSVPSVELTLWKQTKERQYVSISLVDVEAAPLARLELSELENNFFCQVGLLSMQERSTNAIASLAKSIGVIRWLQRAGRG